MNVRVNLPLILYGLDVCMHVPIEQSASLTIKTDETKHVITVEFPQHGSPKLWYIQIMKIDGTFFPWHFVFEDVKRHLTFVRGQVSYQYCLK